MGIILFSSAYAIWPLAWEDFFYQAIAASFMFLFWHLSEKYWQAKIGFWFAVNALVDELFFDPTRISLNEYIFGLITIIVLWQAHQKKQAKSQNT